KSGSLQIVLPKWSTIERDIVLIYQDRNHLSAKIRLFSEHMTHHFHSIEPFK
ncbi:MAG: LysR family transcriptional regulator, partial [Alteromonadaceae bacterium]